MPRIASRGRLERGNFRAQAEARSGDAGGVCTRGRNTDGRRTGARRASGRQHAGLILALQFQFRRLGTLPGRDRDTIGFAVNERRYSSLFVANISAARVIAGGSPNIPREQVMFELNYGYEVSKAVRLTPNIQYVLNPDQGSVPTRTTNISNAFVIGGRVVVDFAATPAAGIFE